jgi:hypothetical protein
MKHAENRRLEAKWDDETSGNAELSGIEKGDFIANPAAVLSASPRTEVGHRP